MKDVNKIILVGRLGSNPVQKETKKGVAVTHFSLATSRKVRAEADPEGVMTGEETQWHRIVSWGKQGQACAQYLAKGHPVYVEGSVRSRKYSTQEGVEKISFEVHAEQVNFLGAYTGKKAEPVEVAASA